MLKKLSIGAIAASIILAISGCSGGTESKQSGTAKKPFEGRTIVVASYGGALDDTFKKNVIAPFEQETGGKVVLDPSHKFAKLVAENGNPSIDLAFYDDAFVIQGGNLGLLEKLDPSKISHWNDLYPIAIDKKQFGLAWLFGSYGIVYNKQQVNPAPTSWGDIFKPEYKGKVAVSEISTNGGVQAFVAAAKLKGGDERHMDPAFDIYKQMAPNFLSISANTAQLTDMLTRGDVVIAPWFDGRALNLEDNKVPIGFVKPKEGAYATVVELAIPKGSKNEDMAYKLIDMSLSTEAQTAFAKEIFYGPTNKNTKLPDDLAKRVVYGEDEIKKLQFVDWEYVATARGQWIDRWNKEIVPLLKK